jgi:redox-sensitive bicupin YhaK (pirin superfamily)
LLFPDFLSPGNEIYIFLLEGQITVNGTSIGRRDGLGISGKETVEVQADDDAEALLMDVPMANMLQV